MKIFDTHAHYYDGRFADEGIDVESLLSSLFDTQIEGIVNVATNTENARTVIKMAKRHKGMYTALGIHPSDVSPDADIDLEIEKLRIMLTDKESRAVALGEIGLDYYWQPYDADLQKKYFDRQLTLSEELGLPAVVHIRDSHGDSFDMIASHPKAFGIIHSYSGSAEMAREYIKRGWYISFSGTVTFKNAARVASVAESLPLDRVLVETDAPYLAPHPMRGKINHSGNLVYTVGKLAELWNIPYDEAVKITTENAKRVFAID